MGYLSQIENNLIHFVRPQFYTLPDFIQKPKYMVVFRDDLQLLLSFGGTVAMLPSISVAFRCTGIGAAMHPASPLASDGRRPAFSARPRFRSTTRRIGEVFRLHGIIR